MDVDIPEENNCVKIEAVFNEFYGITQVTQNYKNQTPNPIELNLTIPLKPEIQFSQFRVQLDDKIIVSRILDKEKAEGKYIDSIAQGNTGIISSYNEKEYDWMKTYVLSKLACVHSSQILGNYIEKKGLNIKAVSLHPGFINNRFFREIEEKDWYWFIRDTLQRPFRLCLFKDNNMGAQTTLHLCYMKFEDIINGAY